MKKRRSAWVLAPVAPIALTVLAVLGGLTALLRSGEAAARPAHRRHHPPAAKPVGFDLTRPEIVAFLDDVSARDSMDRAHLKSVLRKAHRQAGILKAISAPAEAVVPWYEYRENLVSPERVRQGVQFWQAHRDTLEQVAAAHAVPPEYLVAILGVETQYGRQTGSFKVLDALATLAFDYPPRADFFRGELEQFLLLSRESRLNPLTAKGSYAGAMGAPQFMPSAFRQYAVDENGDHRRDLWQDWADILGSVANFLKAHGWATGQPVLAEVQLAPGTQLTAPPKLELNETVASLAAQGVQLLGTGTAAGSNGTDPAAGAPLWTQTTPALLIPAETKEGPAWRVGFQNFYVITRYNRSVRYAMAVHDLAQLLAQAAPQADSPK